MSKIDQFNTCITAVDKAMEALKNYSYKNHKEDIILMNINNNIVEAPLPSTLVFRFSSED